MGATRATIIETVRDLLNDTDANHYAISSTRLNKIIEKAMQKLASRLDYYPEWTTDAITYVSGTKDYEVPHSSNTIEYQRVLIIRRQSDGMHLHRITQEEMGARVPGDSDTEASGDPTHYTLWETYDDQSGSTAGQGSVIIEMRVWPTPGSDESGETLDLLLARIPAALSADTSMIPFSSSMLRALEGKIAATVFRMISEDERQRRKISGDIVPQWESDYNEEVAAERVRTNRQKRLGYVQLGMGT